MQADSIGARAWQMPALLILALGCSDGSGPQDPPPPAEGFQLVFDGAVQDGRSMLFRSNGSRSAPVPVGSGFFGSRPALSPDGRTLVFQSPPADTVPSVLMILEESAVRPVPFLNATGSQETEAAWSPDGTRLAFTAERDDPLGDVFTARVAPLRLEQLKNLTPRSGTAVWRDRAPAWSPDGGRIAYISTRSGVTRLWVMNADGTSPVQVTTDTLVPDYPTWSPDGRWIAYQHLTAAGPRIAVVSSGGGAAREIPWPASARMPAWGPGGIAIASNRDGDYDIYVITPEGEELGRVQRPGDDFNPAWVGKP